MESLESIAECLRPGSPWQVQAYDEVTSTMDMVRQRAQDRAESDWFVAAARVQTAGRGRFGRAWASSEDGLWMTALMRPDLAPDQAGWVTLGAAVAVAEALEGLGFAVGIKWPNDVLVREGTLARRKICGIRCESKVEDGTLDWISVGIGINVNQASFAGDLDGVAASLRQLGGEDVSRAAVAGAVLDGLEEVRLALECGRFADVRQRWLRLALGLGEEAEVSDSGVVVRGTLQGIDEDGCLIVERADGGGRHTVHAGDLVFPAQDAQ